MQFLSYSDKAAVPGLNRNDLHEAEVLFPPLPEQRAIAHILGTLDDKIELNRKKSEVLEGMARALFKAWFVDFEPVRAKMEGRWRQGEWLPGMPADLWDLFPDRLVPSELGEIPEGWGVKALDEVADFVNGAACQRFPPKEGEPSLPVIKIRELNQGVTESSDRVCTNFPEKHRARDGDVLFSWSGSLQCQIWTGGEGFVNQHVFRISSGGFPRWFYFYWTRYHLERFRRIAADKATTMGHIKRSHLAEAKVVVPRDRLVEGAGGAIEVLLDAKLLRLSESQQMAKSRDSLLPKLISGEIRVAPTEGPVD
ncbi:MAG: restriction endonuclease subunit S [Acidobacteria bacterium]|nr:MAG: restriction endonuclease subunit S [Acidobacteriota bacterium]REK09761.1 MAG: restriction endonuclease subunit S [Acidobacteriota bacterium]